MAVQCQRSTAMNCSYCSGLFSAPSEALLLTHIRVTHSSDPGFSIQCSVSGCSRTFTNFRTFQNHRLTHRGKESESGDGTTLDENADTEGDFNSSIAVAHGPTSDDMQSFAAKWILKIRESRSLTRNAMQGVIEDVQDLVSFVGNTMKQQTNAVLRANDIDPSSITGLSDVFAGPTTIPFDGLTSFHQQLQYCRKNFNFIVRALVVFNLYCVYCYKYTGIIIVQEPRRIVLRETSTQRVAGRKRKVVVTKEEAMYIPLLDTLQCQLNNKAILREVHE